MPHIWGTWGDDTLFGTDGADFVGGKSGDDFLFGQGGNDVIFAGAGDDYLSGNEGNDTLKGDGGADTIEIGKGADTVIFDGAARDGATDYVLLRGGESASNDTFFLIGDHWKIMHDTYTDQNNGLASHLWSVQWVEGWDMSDNDLGNGGINIFYEEDPETYWPS